MVDVKCLSDYELHKHLRTLGFTPGPILPSTRKMYEKKLVQLLASPPSELPVVKRPGRLRRPEDSDDSEDPAVNIILKGNIKFSNNKGKEAKALQEDLCLVFTRAAKASFGLLIPLIGGLFQLHTKRPEASTNKGRILDIYYLSQKPTKKVRYAARPSPRSKRRCISKDDYYPCNERLESSFSYQNPRNYFPFRNRRNCLPCQSSENGVPWGLKLAVLGIFFIVLFVYIIVEKKPLFG